jgi:hypothetical protein
MRKLGKFLARLLKFSLAAVLIVATLALVVFTWPNLVINPTFAKLSASYLKQHGTYLEWETLELGARSKSFFEKEVTLKATGFCFHQVDNGMRVCTKKSALKFAAHISYREVTLTEVGPATIEGAGFVWKEMTVPGLKTPETTVPKKDQSVLPENLMLFNAPAWLRSAELKAVDLDVLHVEIETSGQRWNGAGHISGATEGKGSRWTLVTKASSNGKKENYEIKGNINFVSHESRWEGPWEGQVSLAGQTEKQVKTSVEGKLFQTPEAHHYGVNLKLFYVAGKREVDTELRANFDRTALHSVLNGSIKNPAEKIANVTWRECKIESRLDRIEASMDCPLTAKVKLPRDAEPLYHRNAEQLKAVLGIDIKSASPRPAQKSPVDVNLTLAVEPLLTPIREGKGVIRLEASGDLINFPQGWKVQSKTSVEIKKFEKVVQLLANSPYAIPEPVNSLTGALELEVSALGELPPVSFQLPISFKSRLRSATQVISIDGTGQMDLNPNNDARSNKLKMKIVLEDVRMVLPYLSLAAPPRLYPDSRIKVGKPERKVAAKTKSLDYEIEIDTVEGHPLTLKSNLAKKDIPVIMHLKLSPDRTRGTVRIVKFPVELFHRVASVDYFNLKMGDKINASEIEGQVSVDYTDYKVSILISGQADKPVFKFISDPPLAEDQVIAILLFGKTMNNLTGQSIQDVGQARAAAASSAISLGSMYLLASTPIQSIGYDPSTNVFTAKISLADGTSLSIGNDDPNNANQQSIGLKEYLGSHWWINSAVNSAFDPAKRKVESFLEWSNMY